MEHPETAETVRAMVAGQDPEGYSRSCEALADAEDPGPLDPAPPLLLVTGADDGVGTLEVSDLLVRFF